MATSKKESQEMTSRRVFEINVELIVDKSFENIRVHCFRCKVHNMTLLSGGDGLQAHVIICFG